MRFHRLLLESSIPPVNAAVARTPSLETWHHTNQSVLCQAKIGGASLFNFLLFFAGRDPHNLDGIADHVSGRRSA
jgi:hypothetical protein